MLLNPHHDSWPCAGRTIPTPSLALFSPPPSLHAQSDDNGTSSHGSSTPRSSAWASILNPNDLTSAPPCSGGRTACSLRSTTRPLGKKSPRSSGGHRAANASNVRGGSSGSAADGDGAPEVPEPAAVAVTEQQGSAPLPLPATVTPLFQAGIPTVTSTTATSPTTQSFGVALVTERSTATGSSNGLVSYSLLPDGSLRVGPRDGRREPKDERKPSRVSRPAQLPPEAAAVTVGAVTALAGAAGGVLPEGDLPPHRQPPWKVLQELRRRSMKLQDGSGAVVKAVAHEAKAAAVGAARFATGAAGAVRGGLLKTFLPVGYPKSVRPEYLRYRGWDIIQDLSSHLRGVLATQAILEGMGVGRAGSTPLAATLQWMARDGASMIGGLLFTSAASANFGVNIKTWRLFADASNDVGLALEMLAPLPAFREGGRFLRLICVASVFKAACGVAGGATGAAITEHWAVDNNIADVGAKNGAQHTVASLFGLGLSVWFARAVSDAGSASGTRVWGWYIALTVVHLLANYAAMRTLALRSVNPARASLLVGEYLQQALKRGSNRNQQEGEEEGEAPRTDWMGRDLDLEGIDSDVLSPAHAARRETILLLPAWVRALRPWGDVLQINVGVPIRSLVREADDLLWLTSLFHEERAMVQVSVSYQPLGPRLATVVNVALREDSSPQDRLQAVFQANLIHHLLVRNPDKIPHGGDPVDRTLFLRRVTEDALAVTRREFPAFRKALVREGWDLCRVTLGGGPWVGRWGSLAASKDE